MNQILLIDKPAGWTSFDVVAKIRSVIRASYLARGEKPTKKQLRVGHAGTLDPFATGLLIVLLGDACARSNEFLKLDKVYEATVRLGATSTTGDPEGMITKNGGQRVKKAEITHVLQQLTGEITQVPPAHSAIKINGQRAYKLARAGKPVEMPPRQVTIYNLEMVRYEYPELAIRAHVSSGTYIRTLAEDIGKSLGTGAHCSQLRRTRIGESDIDDALTIEQAATAIQERSR